MDTTQALSRTATIAPNTSTSIVSDGPTQAHVLRRRRGRPRLADRQVADSVEEPLARAWRDRQRQKLASQEAAMKDIRAAILRLERLAVQNDVVEKMPSFAAEVFRCVALVRSVSSAIAGGGESGRGSADVSGSERDSGTGTGRSSIQSMVPDQLVRFDVPAEANAVGAGAAGGGNALDSAGANDLGGSAIDDRTMQSEHVLTYAELQQNDFQPRAGHGQGHKLPSKPPSSAAAAATATIPTARHLISTKPPSLPSQPAHSQHVLPTSSTAAAAAIYAPPHPTATLTPLWTYSIHETSFSRRLHRACIEHCYRLLSSHNTRGTEVLRTLKFPLAAHGSVDELRRRAKELLLRGTDQSLYYWEDWEDENREAAREGNVGSLLPSAMRTIVSSAKRPLRSLLSATRHGMLRSGGGADDDAEIIDDSTTVSQIHVSGYEGTWLGPDAVTAYLQCLGIPIQEKPAGMTVPWVVSSHALEDMVLQRGQHRPHQQHQPPPHHFYNTPVTPQHMVVVNMDLDLMVDTLTQRAVCVDTPVFRKDHVDEIVVDALVSWYRSAYGG
ncbi:hypothetical protein AYO22_11572 [Fonsecaea multimorphosa]|nr:hypothetical protein AYO22_11572 [Fonsecaea multimorphosa]